MKSIYVVILLLCAAACAVDPSVYAAFHTPKLLLCILIPFVFIMLNCLYRLIRKEPLTVHISLIECLLLVQLFWSVLGNPGILTNTSTLEVFSLVALFFTTCIIRQIQVRENAALAHQDQTRDTSSLQLMMRTIWIAGVCQALIGFAQYSALFDTLPIGTGKTTMIGFIGTANGYGTFIAISIMAIIIEFAETRSIKLKVVLAVFGGVLLSALLLNGSRGALLALAGAVIVFIFLNRKRWNVFPLNRQSKKSSVPITGKKLFSPVLRFVISTAVLAIILWGFVSYVYHLNTESSQGRLFVWSVSAPMVLDHPIAGVGVGRYSVEYLNYQGRFFKDAQNQPLAYKAANMKQALSEYVQAACESGIVGALLFVTLWVSALWFFLRSQHQTVLVSGAASVLIVILLHMVVDTPLHVIPISVLTVCLLGFTPVSARWVWKFQITTRIVHTMFLGILIAAAGLLAMISIDYYRGHQHWQRGYKLSIQHRWQFAVQEYEKALEKLPQEGELLFHLGAAQIMMNLYSNGIYHLQQARVWYNDRNMYLSLSKGYLGLRQYAEAEHYAQAALAMFPDHLAPHLLLGQIFFETRQIKESKESLLKCIDRKTSIRSDEVEQIGLDAEVLWKQYFANETQ